MNKRIGFIALAAVTLAACSGDRGGLRRDQAQYETVQEGAASGVSPDLNPTTTQPPMAMTGTNADTTSAFTLPSTIPPTAGAPSAPGTIAGTLPPPPAPAPRPRVVERAPAPPPPAAEPPPAPEPPAPAEQPEEEEEAEDAEAPPPAPTSTQPPTNQTASVWARASASAT